MAEIIDFVIKDEEVELPLPCPDCMNRTFHIWEDGSMSCTSCGLELSDPDEWEEED